MSDWTIVPGVAFSLLRHQGFAPQHAHGFILRGKERLPLFRPGPVPGEVLCAFSGIAGATLHLPHQVHGMDVCEVPAMPTASAAYSGSGDRSEGGVVATVSRAHAEAETPRADALITRRAGHAVGVVTADCLPVLLAASDGACAAVHAGWRGLLAGVMEAAVRRFADQAAVEAAIGPAIGPCCFEVGAEVSDRFHARFPDAEGIVRTAQDPAKRMVDLPSAGALALAESGLDPARIRIYGRCTRCGGDDLESFRRDRSGAGRMVALIGPLVGGGGGASTLPAD